MLGESGLGLGVRGFGFTGLGCVEGRYDSLHMLGQVPRVFRCIAAPDAEDCRKTS